MTTYVAPPIVNRHSSIRKSDLLPAAACPLALLFEARLALARLHVVVAKAVADADTNATAVPLAGASAHHPIEFGDAAPPRLVENIVGTDAHIKVFPS